MNDDDQSFELNEVQIEEIAQHIQSEEGESTESALKSEASLELWLLNHPGFRQMVPVDKLSDIVPLLLKVLRTMFNIHKSSEELLDSNADDKEQRKDDK